MLVVLMAVSMAGYWEHLKVVAMVAQMAAYLAEKKGCRSAASSADETVGLWAVLSVYLTAVSMAVRLGRSKVAWRVALMVAHWAVLLDCCWAACWADATAGTLAARWAYSMAVLSAVKLESSRVDLSVVLTAVY